MVELLAFVFIGRGASIRTCLGGGGEDVDIQLAQTATPIPTDEVFDETVESREIALPSSTWYALQLGAFENEKAADELARQFMQRGAAGYVWQDGGTGRLPPFIPRARTRRTCADS